MANIYKSLQICLEEVRGDEAFELLLNFIKEIQVSIRAMVAVAMESVYESIREEKCRTFLGFHHAATDTKMNMEDYLKDRKWTKEIETGLWIPYFDPSQGDDDDEDEDEDYNFEYDSSELEEFDQYYEKVWVECKAVEDASARFHA